MKNEVTARTLEVILAEANAKVDALNKEQSTEQKITLEAEAKKLEKEYNALSLLTAYSAARAHELPIIALAKLCTYATISCKKTPSLEVVDGVPKMVDTYSITEKESALNILKYIKWLEDRNFKMPKGWIGRMSAVKADIIDQWQNFDKAGDEHVFKIGQLKRLLQPMVDDMGMLPGESGKNTLIAKSEHAKFVLKYATKKTGVLTGEVLTPKIWDELLMAVLHSISTSAVFENTYGSVAIYKEETAEEDTDSKQESTESKTTETQTTEQSAK